MFFLINRVGVSMVFSPIFICSFFMVLLPSRILFDSAIHLPLCAQWICACGFHLYNKRQSESQSATQKTRFPVFSAICTVYAMALCRKFFNADVRRIPMRTLRKARWFPYFIVIVVLLDENRERRLSM